MCRGRSPPALSHVWTQVWTQLARTQPYRTDNPFGVRAQEVPNWPTLPYCTLQRGTADIELQNRGLGVRVPPLLPLKNS
jgi:hypothetical protein